MKKIVNTIFFLFIFFSSTQLIAQYGNGYGNGYSNSQINRMQIEPQHGPKEPTIKEKEEAINKVVDKLKSDLSLDDLQVFAIRKEISDNMKNLEILKKSETSEDAKAKEYIALSEKTDKNILSFLNKEQKEKYIKLNEKKNQQIDEYKYKMKK